MSFLIKYDELFEKYNEILKKISESITEEFDSERVFNKKYLKEIL